jgi:hypothetical protein
VKRGATEYPCGHVVEYQVSQIRSTAGDQFGPKQALAGDPGTVEIAGQRRKVECLSVVVVTPTKPF